MTFILTVDKPAELLPYLFEQQPGVKRTKIRQWLKHGSVHVNGAPVTRSNHPLRSGDKVSVTTKRGAPAEKFFPEGLNVLHEDAAVLVIEKPEDLLSVATETEREKTAYAVLTAWIRQRNPRSSERLWIVHRLDRETSGLMVFAKTEAAKHALQANWKETEKLYMAVVEGSPTVDQGVLRSHLDESGPYKVFSAPANDRARLAITHYRVLKRTPNRSLLELSLETGRRNQIRVQLADVGLPIVGDEKYGAKTNPARRLALHAASLRFAHPTTGQPQQFESPLPTKLSRLVDG